MSNSKFQIGTDKLRYIYHESHLVSREKPIYKCRRGQTEGSPYVFWLSYGEDGHWIAREAHKDNENPLRQGVYVFRTLDPVDDITVPGEYGWMWWNDKKQEWKDFKFIFWTKQLPSES